MAEGTPVQALVAVYPLLQTDFEGVERAVEVLKNGSLAAVVSTTHTTVVGQTSEVFALLREAFEAASQTGPTTMTVTITNACSLPDWAGSSGSNLQ